MFFGFTNFMYLDTKAKNSQFRPGNIIIFKARFGMLHISRYCLRHADFCPSAGVLDHPRLAAFFLTLGSRHGRNLLKFG